MSIEAKGMGTTSYVSISLATALERSLDLAAHNMANASTAGYKAQHPLLESVDPSNSGDDTQSVSYVKAEGIYVDLSQGALVQTGNSLDIAVTSQGWLGYQTEDGQTAYGRDGRLSVNNEGQLVNLAGNPDVEEGGAPITIPQEVAHLVQIAEDGTLTDQNGGAIGRIGLFNVPSFASASPIGNGLFLPNPPANAPTPIETPQFAQGFIEQSNVKPVVEMIHLMDIQRAYERATNLMSDDNDLTNQAIQRLGRVV
jgi:flagellar basal-body rod protein FlgF